MIIDFLVTAIDNFGDTGFALDLAESILFYRSDCKIRFFSDDRPLFDKLCQGKIHPDISYFELSEYEQTPPSTVIFSFFDRKIPEAHLAKFPYPKKVIVLSYLRFDNKVGSMSGTRYFLGNDEVIHLVPSPRKDGAGIIISHEYHANAAGRFPTPLSFLRKQESSPDYLNSISVFCYPETLQKIEIIRKLSSLPLLVFEKDIPFVRFDEYGSMLPYFRSNIVRGENSAAKALLSRKPFLWDFYKEKNGAHRAKIEDFLDFMKPFFDRIEDFELYCKATKALNAENFSDDDARICMSVLEDPSETLKEAFERAREEVKEENIIQTILAEVAWE